MEERRQELCLELATSVKKLQGEHVLKKTSPESERGEEERLCNTLEVVFLLDLKNDKGYLWRESKKPNMTNPPQPSFWTFIDPMVSDEVKTQLMALRDYESDIMKCRSWLRVVLNKSLLVSFLEDLQRHPGLLSFHYGGESLLRDAERLEIIIQLLKGLTTIQLGYDYTSSSLTMWDGNVLSKAGIWVEKSSPKPRKVDTKKVSSTPPTPSSPTPSSPSSPSSSSPGVGIINLALNRYSRSSSQSKLQESQMVSRGEMATKRGRGRLRALTFTGSYGNNRGGEGGASEDFTYAVSLDFEVVSTSATPKSSTHSHTLTSLLTRLVPERGLDSQNYLCAACRRPIGVIFGPSKLCKYNGQHYCFDCHIDDERVIPARVLFNWDFRRHRVCRASCEFLDSIAESAVLNLEESNPALYMYIPELEEALKVRQQLNSLREYLSTCRDQNVLHLLQKRLKCPHLCEEIHSYSIHDLSEVQSGALLERMRKAVKVGSRHVLQCSLCSQKGFICEGCHGNKVIYPFDLFDTYQCPQCSALYHQACQPHKGQCSKCLRIRRRQEALVKD